MFRNWVWFVVTEKQLELFERYKHLVPEKIAKYAPEYVDDEDFRQDASVCLVEYIIKNSDIFEQMPRCEVTSSVHRCMNSYIKYHCRQVEKNNLAICSYDDINDLEDSSSPSLEDSMSIVNYYIAKAMYTLNAQEQIVLALRFGFLGRELALSEVGWVFGVTQERIRQIENKAIRKLRNYSRRKYLIDL